MPRVRLVCWDSDREAEHHAAIESAGFEIDKSSVASGKLMTHIRLTQPAAVVIDLDRLPSHGRAVAAVLRNTKSTRAIPLIFAGGEPTKVARLQTELPDATYGPWTKIKSLINAALRKRLQAPVVPPGPMASHNASLEKKLGLPGATAVAVIGAPESFLDRIGLPVEQRITSNTKLAIWFIRSRAELEREIEFAALHPPLWIAFPKQTSRFKSDFTQHDVRRLASEAGLVDNKVCAIDDDWSAIRFARRKP
jgi:hypothetical protein